ncbi:BTB/POZ protein [Rhizophagus irregularis DAOM 181602=DAOM 197198]|nr:BTB/POZ protein [Rhizophagus irregularis DAOM 181602=DAOM 197198]
MNNDVTLVHIKFPNISPEIFQIILKYVYGDPTTWSDNDFKTMESTLQHCLPLVRFFSLSSEDFFKKVRPYKKLLKHQLYEELLESYLNPNSVPSDNILPPSRFGPTFGDGDLDIFAGEGGEYSCRDCVQQSYEKKIRDTSDLFTIEDYEVFQIIRKNDNYIFT